jgi:long-chain acyl-CoA synthetase
MNATDTTLDGRAENRIWLKSYPEGVPAEIPPLAYASLPDLFEKSCKSFADRDAFYCMGKSITYRALDEEARKIAAWLQSKGLAKGDRVAVMFPNILQYPVTVFAILRAGYVVVNVNPLYTPRELEHQLNDSGAKVIFVVENFASTVAEVVARTSVRHVVVATMGDMLGLKGLIVNFVVRKIKKMVPSFSIPGHTPFRQVLAEGAAMRLQPVSFSHQDVAFLQYTGGTTGVSKGATLSHANILANASQSQIWLAVAFRVKTRPAQLIFACPLPLYHIFGLTVNMVMGMVEGANNVLIPNPRDLPAFIKELRNFRINVFPGLNTLFNGLANNADFARLDFSGLMLTLAGGMACQRPVAEKWQRVTGNSIIEGYGLSETSPIVTANRCDATEFSGTIGLPIPSTDVEIRDDDGRTLPIGEIGEICIRGPQVMPGYWNRPEDTAKSIMPDGFFRSGDVGFMDAKGYVKIVDRKKDMILVSGFNVYPNEVEEVCASHPGVLECAAIGVPDAHAGEAVKLFVVKKDPALTEADVKAHCAAGLTNYKRPKYVEFRDSLPKSNVGKILRRELR